MPKAKSSTSKTDGSAMDFEAHLCTAADKMRGHMDTTRKLARMNLAIRGLRNADSFRQDLHPGLKADFVPVRKNLANLPFNMSDWGGENLRQDVRWKFGLPPVKSAG